MVLTGNTIFFFSLFCLISFTSCRKKGCTDVLSTTYDVNAKKDDGSCYYPAPYSLNIPKTFETYLPYPVLLDDNPLTEEGVKLGRMLYYDPIIDNISNRSCSKCHLQSSSFTSPINSLPHLNLAWSSNFLWEGEVQGTVEDVMKFEIEEFFNTDVSKLNNNTQYADLFKKAFGVEKITTKEVEYALAQFIRTLITGDSKFDNFLLNQATLTPSEYSGYNIFMDERGDCFHCHGDPTNPLWTDNKFHNNGLDAVPELGLGAITGNSSDNGKFKTPTLRNLTYSAPYMHDGRFNTLDEVILHYSIGLQNSPTIDPLMKKVAQGGLQLTPQEMLDLKDFLLTLTDESITTNANLSNPF